jgi:cell division septation protein DedD
MKSEAATLDDDFDELDDVDQDDGEERGLSGLFVLLLGVVMLGALAAVVFVAYRYGMRTGQEQASAAPYVTAEPEPLKIENKVDPASGEEPREVYDQFAGQTSEPVEVIAKGPEEPVNREAADPIGSIAAETTPPAEDAVADRIAELAKADAALATAPAKQESEKTAVAETPAKPEPKPATTPTPVSATSTENARPSVSYRDADAMSGTHLVQVGAFRSESEANTVWTSLKGKLGDYANDKSPDIERADLGAKGVYYRLRIGPFSSSDDAKTYCAGLKQRGTDCLIKSK